MASIVSAGTTSSTALNMSADTSGVLQLASNNGTVGLTMDTSQNVGIGTSSPSQKLQVANGNIYISTTNYLMWNSGGSYAIDSDASTRLSFYSGSGTERMRIDNAGNVGIGTTSPIRKLTVSTAGAAEFVLQDTSQAANSRNWRIFNTSNTLYFGTLNDAGNSGTDAVKITSSANLQFNSGYGSVATAYGCRAWVMFNGSNGSIFAQGNVSSVTRNGTGQYVVNYSTAMPDGSYSAVTSCSGQGSVNGSTNCMLVNASAGGTNVTPTTTSTSLFCYHPGNQVAQDTTFVTFAVFR
jgi:hypothetical protein